jgi:hypothetical protein
MKGSKPFTACEKLLGLDLGFELGTWKFSLFIVHMLQSYQICIPCKLMKGSKPCTACAKLLGLDLGFELGTWKLSFFIVHMLQPYQKKFTLQFHVTSISFSYLSCENHVFIFAFDLTSTLFLFFFALSQWEAIYSKCLSI